jgi:membrane-bound lytic murein transglycosylase D
MVLRMMRRSQNEATPAPPAVRVSTGNGSAACRELEFHTSFRIGRTDDCDVCIKNEFVSRAHVEVSFDDGQWWVRDLNSSNGMFVGGNRADRVPIPDSVTIQLGIKGPCVTLDVQKPAAVPPPPPPEDVVARYVDHYFGERPAGAPVGEHTMYVRQAFSRVQTKQKRRYTWIVALLAVLLIVAGAIAFFEHREASKQRTTAKEIFYAMKDLDLNIASVEKLVTDSGSQQGMEQVRNYRKRRRDMEANYDRFLSTLRVYDPKMTPQERLVLRVARIFGECEIDMPPQFMSEIKNYIGKWQSSPRLAKAVLTAKANGYAPVIAKEFLDRGLPPEFFYLALQESDFDPLISGPMTHKGIAKGMWQFIPETAIKYGLKVGPLLDLRRADTNDDRHHWERETRAAADYIKDLYTTDAQASGLLVMACYNWGEDRVLPLVRSMPANPRERNFWRLLTKYRDKLPQQTYDYVFYIASAAVIGEDPRLFGFDFDSPLPRQ